MSHRIARLLAIGLTFVARGRRRGLRQGRRGVRRKRGRRGQDRARASPTTTISLGAAHRPQRRLRAARDRLHPGAGACTGSSSNADGGVCGRNVKLVNKDAGYDVQKAVSLYRDTGARRRRDLAGRRLADHRGAAADDRAGLDARRSPRPGRRRCSTPSRSAIIGATYDIEAINGIEWMMENKGLKEGDKIGDLYFEGDFGEGGLIGVKHIAEEKGLEVVEQKIKATDEDMSSAAATFKREGVKAIWVTTGPTQLASLVGVAAASGLTVPIGTNGPVFAPAAARHAGRRRARPARHRVQRVGDVLVRQPGGQEARRRLREGLPEGHPAAGGRRRLRRGRQS